MKVGLMPRVHAYTLASPPPSPGWGTWGPHVSQRTSCAHRHNAPVPTLASLFLLALFPTRLPRESRSLRVRERRRGSHNWINRPRPPATPSPHTQSGSHNWINRPALPLPPFVLRCGWVGNRSGWGGSEPKCQTTKARRNERLTATS